MKDHDLMILLLQETHINETYVEKRKTHTWYFSGDESKNTALNKKKYTEAGVCIVIDNKSIHNVADIKPN